MKLSPSAFKLLLNLALIGFIFLPLNVEAQNLEIDQNTVLDSLDSPREVDDVIYRNSSKLTIEGTLIVNGNFNMDQNDASLELGEDARLIIYGGFIAANKVNITLGRNSYLFVYGNFTKGGASNQDVVIIDNAKIYILGDEDNWGGNFTSCEGNYEGNTTDENEDCDFGKEEDFENNQDDFPEDLIDQINCYDLSGISDQTTCVGGSVNFSVKDSLNVDFDEVNFTWQIKESENADWQNIEDAGLVSYDINQASITINEVTTGTADYLYRLIVKPSPGSDSSCSISISRKVKVLLNGNPNTWTGNDNTDWNNTANWSCNTLPGLETNVLIPGNITSGNYPVITAGNNALAKNLVIENNASVQVIDNWLRIADILKNDGILNVKAGSISFEGTSSQTIPTAAFEDNLVKNLRIDNNSGVNSNAIIDITGVLEVTNGVFNTGDQLTLISDEDQTALIAGTGKGEVTGLVSMQRYLDKAFGYKYFSSPFQNSTVGDFTPYMDLQDTDTGFPHFYRYDENRRIDSLDLDATGWEPYIDEVAGLEIAEGYAVNFGSSSASKTIELTGTVNNGTIPTKQLQNNHRKYTKGFHLIGNPYPSPIDWNAASGWTRNNIDDAIYFFTASSDSQYTGTYTAFVNDISTGDSLVDGRSSNIISSMQGFFIKVSDSETQDVVTGDFGMNNNVRVTDFDQEFLRTQEFDQRSILRIEAGFQNDSRKDPMVIYFSSRSSLNFEKEMDAHKLMNTDPALPNFYNITETGKQLAINAVPYPEAKSYNRIPLGIKTEKSGKMTINLKSVKNISPNLNIYLIDHSKGIGQNLSRRPEYTFEINKGIYNNRFELMFSEEEVKSPAIAFNEPLSVETSKGNILVKLNLDHGQSGILRASTMTGQILQVKQASGNEEVEFSGIRSEGVYIINLQVGKSVYSKKVVLKK